MSDRVCPGCGAKKSNPYLLEFRCGTTGLQYRGRITWRYSDYCKDHQLARKDALIREATEVVEGLEEILIQQEGTGYECVSCYGWHKDPEKINHIGECKLIKAAALLPKLKALKSTNP